MFEGRRDLFKGLAIDKLPWEGWKSSSRCEGALVVPRFVAAMFNIYFPVLGKDRM